jgi:hypothetical protein
MEAPNRGELGETEAGEIRSLLGGQVYAAMLAFEKIEPKLQRGDEVVARLREANIDLGATESSVRNAAAETVQADDEINRRVYVHSPIDATEESQLFDRAFARYEPLRRAVEQANGPQALNALDSWIRQKINSDLAFTKEILALSAGRH